MKGYKGFNEDFSCLDQRYYIGEIVTVQGDLEMCVNGLHFCDNPLYVFGFYSPNKSRYAEIHTDGEVLDQPEGHFPMTKHCARSLTADREIDACEMLYRGIDWIRDHANESVNVYTQKYAGDTIQVTVEPDEHGYWRQASSLLVSTELGSCVINDMGSISLTLSRFSVAVAQGTWKAVALAHGSQSAALAKCSGSVAITMGMDSVALAEGDCSLAMVGGASLAIVKGRNSVTMSSFTGSKLLLEGDGCVAMASGTVEVKGKGCVVMLQTGYERKAVIRSVAGTRLLVPVFDTPSYIEIICGVHHAWPAGVIRSYRDIVDAYLKEEKENV